MVASDNRFLVVWRIQSRERTLEVSRTYWHDKKDSQICGGSKLTEKKRAHDENLLIDFFEHAYADNSVARIMETSVKQIKIISPKHGTRYQTSHAEQRPEATWMRPRFYQVTNSIAEQDTCPWRYFKGRVSTTQPGRKARAPCYYFNKRETYAAPETHRTSTVMRRHCGLLWSSTWAHISRTNGTDSIRGVEGGRLGLLVFVQRVFLCKGDGSGNDFLFIE